MHDGGVKTLEEVIEFYDRGGNPNRNLDPEIRPLRLTAEEKKQLVAYLESLTGSPRS
jgi:cytochrome c peroxidase